MRSECRTARSGARCSVASRSRLPTGASLTPDAVLGPARPGRRVVLSGDTAPTETVQVLAEGADVLVHEATFTDDERDRAEETLHSTARQAAELARAAGVRLLALTHVSPRHPPGAVLAEAESVFVPTVVPRDFDVIEVPFAERGEPRLLRKAARPAAGRRPPTSSSCQSCQTPPRSTGTRVPSRETPVTETSLPPIMKSMWIELALMRS